MAPPPGASFSLILGCLGFFSTILLGVINHEDFSFLTLFYDHQLLTSVSATPVSPARAAWRRAASALRNRDRPPVPGPGQPRMSEGRHPERREELSSASSSAVPPIFFGPRGRIFTRFYGEEQGPLGRPGPIYDAVVRSNISGQAPSRSSHVDSSSRNVSDFMGQGFPAAACQITDRSAALELADFAKNLQKHINKNAEALIRPIESVLPEGGKFEIRLTHPGTTASLVYRLIRREFLGAGSNGVVFKVMGERGQEYAMKIPLVRFSSVGTGWSVPEEVVKLSKEELWKKDAEASCNFVEHVETKVSRLLGKDSEQAYNEMHLLSPVMTGRIINLELVTPLANDRGLTNVAILFPHAVADLDQVLSEGEPPEHVKMEITRQMIGALARLHSLGLVHLDIKPGNFVVDGSGNIVLSDMADVEPVPLHDVPTLRAGIEGPGTPNYLPPERAMSRGHPSPLGDAWSLGVTLHQLWFGSFPFNIGSADDKLQALQSIALAQPEYNSPRGSHVPKDIERILRGLLQTDPFRRITPLEIVKKSPIFALHRRFR
ncbi:rhoptry kinase family protein rop32 [Cystoisospora suis]|uniref:Rhoptry kinase family protein rop32 n=1 Tax=Cystoisospora suis TaxID=483139 RepID=A0A2C6KYI5_9APIC|nr:rhoptry kinase family protein rop32 [Cystoisospora suis]